MQMNKNILALMPVFVFMIIMLIVSIYVHLQKKPPKAL